MRVDTVESDSDGRETSGSSERRHNATGVVSTEKWHYDAKHDVVVWARESRWPSGRVTQHSGTRPPSGSAGAPSETPFGSRDSYEVEVARYVPWLADIQYLQWKRESELVKSGGRISQPGGQPTLVLNEGPEVGASGVVNCGDANTMPCARTGGVEVDTRGRLGGLSQPGRGVPAGPIDQKAPPGPIPEPRPPE